MSFTLNVALFLSSLFGAQQTPSHVMDVAAIAKANTETVKSIHSLSVFVEVEDDLPNDGSSEPKSRPYPNYTFSWFKRGDDERIHQRIKRPDSKGFLRSSDTYNGKRGHRELMNYDHEHPTPLSDSIDGPGQG